MPDALGPATIWVRRSKGRWSITSGIRPRVRFEGRWRPVEQVIVKSRAVLLGFDDGFIKVHRRPENVLREVLGASELAVRYPTVTTHMVAPQVTFSRRAPGVGYTPGSPDTPSLVQINSVLAHASDFRGLPVQPWDARVIGFAQVGSRALHLDSPQWPGLDVPIRPSQDPATYSHGDLTLENIFFGIDGMTVIDYEHAGHYPFYFDACHFLLRAAVLWPDSFVGSEDVQTTLRSSLRGLPGSSTQQDVRHWLLVTSAIMLGRELEIRGVAAERIEDIGDRDVIQSIAVTRRRLEAVGVE